MKDEGIVQAISKELEQLSRRLHQKCRFPGEIRGACFSPATYDASWSKDGTSNDFTPMPLHTLQGSSTAKALSP
jgi:hypothetical protein